MKQVKLTIKQLDELYNNGYTFTTKSYYWMCHDGNIANRITKAEFFSRDVAEPLQGVEQIRIYERCKNNVR